MLKGMARYSEVPFFRQYLADADLISGVLVGVDDHTIRVIQGLLSGEGERCICLVIVLFPASPTRDEHLRSLNLLRPSKKESGKVLDIRLLPMSRFYHKDSERMVLPPTVIQAHDSKSGQTTMSIGSIGDMGNDPVLLGSFNAVFRPDDALRDQWRKWFQFVLDSATPLDDSNVAVPHLVPAKGDLEAAQRWEEYAGSLLLQNAITATSLPEVDPTTGEVLSSTTGTEAKRWDGGMTALDPLAQTLQQVYAKGCLVTVDEATRIKPLTIPVKATLLGQQSERTVGSLKQKQSFTLQVFDEEVNKAVEKCRKVTDLLELLAYPLSSGNRWTPETAKPLMEKEIEARNAAGQQSLIKALGGSDTERIDAFIAAKAESIRENLNEMYHLLGQGKDVPADKFQAVLDEVKQRISQALNTRVTPRLVFNRISSPDLTGSAPDTNWSQPFNLLHRAAQAMRDSLVDPYFPRQFSGMTFGELEFRKACDPFGDEMTSSRDFTRAKDELRVLAKVVEADMPLKAKCAITWQILKGMPHFYFETQFDCPARNVEWPESFSIITAYAPTGQQGSPAQNIAADHALESELRESTKWLTRLTGFSPETNHAEPGWAVDVPWQKACDLGLKLKQDAIYHVMKDDLFVSYCDGRRALVPVGNFKERLKNGGSPSKR